MDIWETGDVARIADVSLRQLQWWHEKGVVSPQIIDHRRNYSREQAVEVCVIAELRRRGLSLQEIRRHQKFLRDTLINRHYLYMLVIGKQAVGCDDSGAAIEIIKRSKKAVHLICLSDHVNRVMRKVAA